MPESKQLKIRAKEMMAGNYGRAVVVVLIGIIFAYFMRKNVIIDLLYTLLIMPALEIGMTCYFVMVYRGGRPQISTMFSAGFMEYPRKIGGMLLITLAVMVGFVLLIVPGVIISLMFAMVPYIFAVYPNVTIREAMDISRRVMNGHKAEFFILQLSFLGWIFISVTSCGIAQIFYVGPYIQTTMAGYYDELIEFAIRCGILDREELGIMMPLVAEMEMNKYE
jgi:uncharacterized membrane protein